MGSLSLLFLVFTSVIKLIACSVQQNDEGDWQPLVRWDSNHGENAPMFTKRKTRSKEFDSANTVDLSQAGVPPLILDSPSADDQQAGILFEDDLSNHCVPIHEPICQGLQYAHTRFPNSVGLSSQDEAAKRMNDYRALISVGCSHYLKFFLCTVYFPMCTPQLNSMTTLQPCESLCRYVQSKCEPIMKSFSFPWPKELNCNALPKSTAMCIQPQDYHLDQQSSHQSSASLLGQGFSSVGRQTIAELIPDLTQIFSSRRQDLQNAGEQNQIINSKETLPSEALVRNPTIKQSIKDIPHKLFQGVHHCRASELSIRTDKTTDTTRNITCAQQCHADVFYRPAEKQFSDIWLMIWSVLCVLSCLLTLLTFILDRARFAYPERPIVYISACYLFYSLGFALRLGLGRDRVACREYVTTNPSPMAMLVPADTALTQLPPISDAASGTPGIPSRESYLIVSGFEGTWCTVVFILLYYFGQAGYIWWLMLSVTWFLSAACKWGSEGIEAISSVLHMLAWALPALKTMIVLLTHRIDADELTGLCHIGHHDASSLLFFIMIPQICYLVIGLCFLILGFFSLVSVRSNLKHHAALLLISNRPQVTQGHQAPSNCSTVFTSQVAPGQNGNIRRLDKLMAKICIFSILYIIPTICVIAVNIYKYGNFSKWQQDLDRLDQRSGCLTAHGTNWAQADLCLDGLQFPSVEANMLQVFMSLVVGITSGMWVWCNRKTFTTWTHCVRTTKKTENGTMKVGIPVSKVNIKNDVAPVDLRAHADHIDSRARRDKAPWASGKSNYPVHHLTFCFVSGLPPGPLALDISLFKKKYVSH